MAVFSVEGKGLKLEKAEDVEKFVKEVESLDGLEEVCLSGNSWGYEACDTFAKALHPKKDLKVANLADILTGRLKDTVPKILLSFEQAFLDKKLTYLDFSDNAFGPSGAEALSGILKNVRSLQYLRINNNGLGPQGGKIIGRALADAQRLNEEEGKASQLKTIIIGRNRLENGAMEELSAALAMHKNLTEVCLPQNGIRPEGIKVLLSNISKCPMLESLDLQDNTFTESGSFALSGAIQNWPKLRKLNVGDCLLGATGAQLVLKALKESHLPLVYLNLQYNEMDEAGALMMAGILESFDQMISLLLNGNAFNPDGPAADAIRSTLERMQKEDILDSWSDMEYESETEEDEDLRDEEKPQDKKEEGELLSKMTSLKL